jgi:hypothetical protein
MAAGRPVMMGEKVKSTLDDLDVIGTFKRPSS